MSGKRLLMLRGYTYSSSNGRNYYCSKKDQGCRARVKLDGNKQLKISKIEDLNHNHSKPTFVLTSSGVYMKISS